MRHSVSTSNLPAIWLLFFLVSVVTGASSFGTQAPVRALPLSFKSSGVLNISKNDKSRLKFWSIRGGQSRAIPTTTTSRTNPLQAVPNPSNLFYFDNAPFRQFNTIMIMANFVGFVVSLVSGTQLHLDLVGTGAFALASIPTLLASEIPRIQISSACVSLWGTKLASFLFFRALKIGSDKRLDDTLSTISGTAFFWTLSLVWGVVCSLPHSLGATSSYNVPVLSSPCSLAGTSLFVLGIVTETTADVQKWIFKNKNPGQFCNVGLWSISQHPNFLGNILLWTGIFLLNAPALIDPAPSTAGGAGRNIFQTLWRCKRLALAALSPIMMYNFFTGQADGSLSNTQELAMKKYGNDPDYRKYINTVPLIFPNPLKLK